MSVLMATFAVPVWVRARGTGDEAFTRIARIFAPFVLLYILLLIYVFPRLS